MGFDFLLVQPQAFIEKKKPRLSRYTWQAMPAFDEQGDFRFKLSELRVLPLIDDFALPLCERSGDVANMNIVVILSGSTYGYIRRYNVPAFSEAGIESIQNRQQQEKILQKSADKHLFQCYRVKHGRKSCRQQNIPKRTIKRNEGALRPKMAAALLLVLFGGNKGGWETQIPNN